jgi:hypothetical protein
MGPLRVVAGMLAAMAGAFAADFSGTIEAVETLETAQAPAADRPELDDYLRTLQDRLARTRAARLVASGPAARILAQDEIAYQNELDQCLFARGGAVVVGRTRMWVADGRVRLEGDFGTILADPTLGRAWIAAGEAVVESALLPAPPVLTGEAQADGTVRVVLTVDGQAAVAVVRPDLANPFARVVLPRGQVVGSTFGAALASLPGMPVRIEMPGRTTRRLVFTAAPGAVDPAMLATP